MTSTRSRKGLEPAGVEAVEEKANSAPSSEEAGPSLALTSPGCEGLGLPGALPQDSCSTRMRKGEARQNRSGSVMRTVAPVSAPFTRVPSRSASS